jgi:hypothetical protein
VHQWSNTDTVLAGDSRAGAGTAQGRLNQMMVKLCYESHRPDNHNVLAVQKAVGTKNNCMEPAFAVGQAGLHMGVRGQGSSVYSGQDHVQQCC